MSNGLISDEIIQSVIKIAKQAGAVIMNVYHADYDIKIKPDNSPVTDADKKANTIITNKLKPAVLLLLGIYLKYLYLIQD